jgi:hypothetical protein
MVPPRQEKSPEPGKNEKNRFQIVKLEERIAPSHRGGGGGNSVTLSFPSVPVHGRGSIQ